MFLHPDSKTILRLANAKLDNLLLSIVTISLVEIGSRLEKGRSCHQKRH